MNYVGAEGEYLDKLDSLVTDMGDVQHESKESYHRESKRKIMSTVVVVIVLLVVVSCASFLIYRIVESFQQPAYTTEELLSQMAFEEEYFDKLEELYEQGEYDEILAIMNDYYEHSDSDNNFAWWSHFDFMFYYGEYVDFLEIKHSYEQEGALTEENVVNLLYLYYGTIFMSDMTEEEIALVEQYQLEQYVFLQDEVGFSKEEIEEMDQVSKDGSVTLYNYYWKMAREKVE